MSNKSQITEIENKYQFNTDNFSTVDKLGSFVVNRKFSEGYQQLKRGEDTRESYIWNVLSAIGNDIGNVVYSNVINYIDFVSNIDICKIIALKSMLKQIGIEYQIFEQLNTLPIEIQNLVDILSINRKYIKDDRVVRDQIVSALYQTGSITDISEKLEKAKDQINKLNNLSAIENHKTLNGEVFEDDVYKEFIFDSYLNLISCFLDLEYNIDPAKNDSGETVNYYIRKSDSFLSEYRKQTKPISEDEYDSDTFYNFKIENGIDVSFDQNEIVDNIEQGYDSLDNYNGYELELLNMELKRRSNVLTKSDIVGQINGLIDKNGEVVLRKTRYSYYRKAKVLEYANFIDNKFFTDNQQYDIEDYKYDTNYFQLDTTTETRVFSYEGDINEDVIKYVAKYLTNITLYIQKLREKFKLQTRKYYMKGTNLLLKYVINEYLIDYSRANLIKEETNEYLGPLSSHNIDNIDIIEYFDTTEYYNISSEFSNQASGDYDVNRNFWNEVVNNKGEAEEQNAFSKEQIEKFYLETMLSENKNIDKTNFYDFLNSMYKLGANSSFLDKNTGVFSSKLANGKYAHEIYPVFVELSTAVSVINNLYLSSDDFSYDSKTDISTQISSTINEYIYNNLSVKYYNGIYDIFNEFNPQVEELSQSFENLKTNYDNLISGDNILYLEKSDVEYCYVDYSKENDYKHDGNHGLGDYYINNKLYEYQKFKDKIDSLLVFTKDEQNIRNWPVLDTLEYVVNNFSDISSSLVNGVINNITEYGFIDVKSQKLTEELQNTYDFLNKKINDRLAYLTDLVNALKTQANQALENYNSANNSFTQAIATYTDKHPSYSLGDSTIYCVSTNKTPSSENPEYSCSARSSQPEDPHDFIVYCTINGWWYYGRKKETGPYTLEEYSISPYNPSDTFEARCSEVQSYIGANTSFTFINSGDGSYTRQYYNELNSEGIQAAVDQAVNQLGNIKSQYENIVNQINTIGMGYVDPSSGDIHNDILKLIDFLNTSLDESYLSKDGLIKKYKEYINQVITLSASYSNVKEAYDSMFSNSKQVVYFNEHVKQSIPTMKELVNISSYCIKKDETNKKSFIGKIQDLYDAYHNRQDDFIKIASRLSSINYKAPTTYLEDQLEDMKNNIQADLDIKLYNAKTYIEDEIQLTVKTNYGIISNHLSDMLDQKTDLNEKVYEKIEELNIFKDEQYIKQNEMFNRYTGLSEISQQPTLNHKNKTHPSYQVHPFLWSFVEREDSMVNTLSKVIETIDPLITPDLLKQYIGEFGQVINVWNTNSKFFDTTGYVTRYELSQNQPKDLDIESNEVVDYDGAFYPPAVEMLRNNFDECIEQLKNKKGEFYNRFFKHLSMNQVELNRECQQIIDYYPIIKDITSDHTLQDIYDIYKYAIDVNGNSYILYKKYGKKDPTFKEMRNTMGSIWIRLSEHPFAFPAFSGLSTQMIDVDSNTNGAIRNYLSSDQEVDISCIVEGIDRNYTMTTKNVKKMKYFYDMHFTKNKQNISFVGYNNQNDGRVTRQKNYDNAWVLYSQPQFTSEDLIQETYTTITLPTTNNSGERTDDYIACGNKKGYVEDETDNNTNLLGLYQKNVNELWSVYIRNPIYKTENPYIIIWRSKNSQASKYIDEQLNNLTQPSISSDWCFSYNSKDDKITLAYIAENKEEEFDSGYTTNVNYNNAEGAVIDDPEETEMNSHDVFENKIVTVDVKLKNKDIIINEKNDIHSYNINADMSYTPLYPGKRHESDMSNNKQEFYALELLGESKNIDQNIGLVNTNVNPYFDYQSIYDGIFGRVYENYLSAENKSLKILKNKSLFKNIPKSYSDNTYESYGYIPSSPSQLQWSICLSNINFVHEKETGREHKTENRYTEKDYQNLQLLIYNKNTLGQNPYFIGSLSSVVKSGVVPITYSDKIESGEHRISSETFNNGVYCCYTETYNLSNSINDSSNNRINNIDSIIAKYNDETKVLDIRFVIEGYKQEFAHIPEGNIEILLYNTYDLTIFEKYHMLDAYGLIKDVQFKDTIKNNVIGDGWQIVYEDYQKYTKEELEQKRPYYYDDDGVIHLLSSVHLSDYSYLSDVFVLNTEKKLAFKYDEELRFDLSSNSYYYPSLNRKYPKNTGDLIDEGMFQSNKTSDLEYIKSIFNDKNIFIVNLDNGDEIANNIGTVYIDSNDVKNDEFRAYEDYYDDQNFLKYDDNDPQCLQFLHIQEISNDNAIISNITEDDFKGMTTDTFIENMRKKHEVYIKGIKSESTPDQFAESRIQFNVDSESIDIDNSCKIYANYKKNSDNKLVLYFNYFNYIETPYIKIKDGYQYPDIIDNTYLKLNPGESGVLDIIVQFRYYYGNKLHGLKNIKTLSYMIHNISDDKPKFVVKKIYEIQKGEYQPENRITSVSINAGNIDIDLDELTYEEKVNPIYRTLEIFIDKSGELKSDVEFYIEYPYEIMEITQESYSGCEIDKSSQGCAHIKVTKKSITNLNLDIKFKSAYDMSKFVNNTYIMNIYKCDLVDANGVLADVTTNEGYITIRDDNSESTVFGVKDGTDSESKILTIEKDTAVKTLKI